MRGKLLHILLVGLVLLVVGACSNVDEGTPKEQEPVPQNLLIITIDTLRADHLGCYGYDRPTSPFIDRAARIGTRFHHTIAPAPLTLPSHCSIMTGQLPITHGARTNWTTLSDDGVTTLAEMCQERGFQTAAVIGGWVLERKFGLAQGFETYEDALTGPYRSAGEVVPLARAWLEERTKPHFFLWVHLMDPHSPYTPPSSLIASLDPRLVPRVQELESIRRATVHDGHLPTKEEISDLETLYDSEILFADRAVGALMKLLSDLGLLTETLVVITADHGEGFDHDYYFAHGDRLYDSELRVPLILVHPTVVPVGRVVNAQIRSIDILPTVCEIFGWSVPADVDGVSLTPFLNDPGELPVLTAFSETYLRRAKSYREHQELAPGERSDGTLSSLRTQTHKLIHTRYTDTQATHDELYAIQVDPLEERDLASDEEARVAELRRVLDAYISRAGPIDDTVSERLTEEDMDRLRSLGYIGH